MEGSKAPPIMTSLNSNPLHWQCIRNAIQCKQYHNVQLLGSDGVSVSSHQVLLAALSPMLRDVLLTTQAEEPVIQIPDFPSRIINIVVHVLHNGTSIGSEVDMEHVSLLLSVLNISLNILNVSIVPPPEVSDSDDDNNENDVFTEMLQCVLEEHSEQQSVANVTEMKKRGRPKKKTDHNYMPETQCKECHKDFASVHSLQQHLRSAHGFVVTSKTYPCTECNKVFVKSSGLSRHKKYVHEGVKESKCEVCEKAFATHNHLQRHLKTHQLEDVKVVKVEREGGEEGEQQQAEAPPPPCSVCGKHLPTPLLLRRHMLSHNATNNKTYQCDRCMKCFPRSSSLWRHVRSVHEGWKPFVCQMCPKAFSSEDHLKRHMNTHCRDRSPRLPTSKPQAAVDPKPCLCPICGKVFTTNHNIAQHMRIHSGEKPYQCKVCGKAFSCKSYLKDHHRIHTGEKPFQCTVCGKTFKCRSHLCEHNRIHTGERPFRCSVCQKAFSHGNHLKKHMSIHSGDKPYECSICGKYFSRGYNRNAHMKIHFKGQ